MVESAWGIAGIDVVVVAIVEEDREGAAGEDDRSKGCGKRRKG